MAPARRQRDAARDTDGTDIDWGLFSSTGSSNGMLPINDPRGLTINGNGGGDTIIVNTGNPLPNMLHLNGSFTISGLSGSNPLGGVNLEIGRSTVFISYSSSDPLSAIQGYLKAGFNNGAWNGSSTATTGVITSIPAAQNAAQTTAIGYADSADGLIAGQPVNTVELKYTLYGDTALIGSVGFNAFTRMIQHWNQTIGGTWGHGGFQLRWVGRQCGFPADDPNIQYEPGRLRPFRRFRRAQQSATDPSVKNHPTVPPVAKPALLGGHRGGMPKQHKKRHR